MSKHNLDPKPELLISLADISAILRKKRKAIVIAGIAFAMIAFVFLLNRPILYQVEASFKEKGKASSGMDDSLLKVFGGGKDSKGSSAYALMTSRPLIASMIKKLHLQGTIREVGTEPRLLERWKDRWKLEMAHQNRRERVDLYTPLERLKIVDIAYDGDTSIGLTIKFVTDDTYHVFSDGKKMGQGSLQIPFQNEQYAFTLNPIWRGKLKDRQFIININPLKPLAGVLGKAITFSPAEEDSSIVKLTYLHPNREEGIMILDTLMTEYQNHLKNESDRYAEHQMSYLKQRQQEMAGIQAKAMKEHAASLSQDLSKSGVVSFDKEIELLFGNRQRSYEKAHDLELKIRELQALLNESEENPNQIYMHQELTPVNGTLQQLSELRLQRDALNLALTESTKNDPTKAKSKFVQHLTDLEQIEGACKDIDELIECAQLDRPFNPSNGVVKQSSLVISEWFDKLNKAKENRQDFDKQKRTFIAYLTNLKRLYEMHRAVVEERLSHNYRERSEFQGIDLETASQLYLANLKDSNAHESMLNEYDFILGQLEDPDFEITSLSSTLKDPISQEIINKSAGLTLMLRDEEKYTAKEKERTKSEIETQKRFLQGHLKQSASILKLENGLLQEKIITLQSIMLDLTHEKISLLEKHIKDFIVGQLNQFYQQRDMADRAQMEINQQMALLPEKWISEQTMRQTVDLNRAIVEELTRFSETKNIAHNLEVIQSAPIEQAYASLLPKHPRLFLLSCLAAVFGAALSGAFFVGKAVVQGVEVTPDNLQILRLSVAGSLSLRLSPLAFLDVDLETLRRQIAFMEEGRAKLITLLLGSGPDYSAALASLLRKRGKRVLIVPLTFDEATSQQSGLLQYLHGEVEAPTVVHEESYDRVFAGGVSRYSIELIASDRFRRFLNDSQEKYDWIICVAKASADTPEAVSYLNLGGLITVTVKDEKLHDLRPFTALPAERVSFIFTAHTQVS